MMMVVVMMVLVVMVVAVTAFVTPSVRVLENTPAAVVHPDAATTHAPGIAADACRAGILANQTGIAPGHVTGGATIVDAAAADRVGLRRARYGEEPRAQREQGGEPVNSFHDYLRMRLRKLSKVFKTDFESSVGIYRDFL